MDSERHPKLGLPGVKKASLQPSNGSGIKIVMAGVAMGLAALGCGPGAQRQGQEEGDQPTVCVEANNAEPVRLNRINEFIIDWPVDNFGSPRVLLDFDTTNIGVDVVKQCGGLPIAILSAHVTRADRQGNIAEGENKLGNVNLSADGKGNVINVEIPNAVEIDNFVLNFHSKKGEVIASLGLPNPTEK